LNLSFDQAKSARVKNWRLSLEDFKPEIEHIKGEANADAASVTGVMGS